MEDEPKEEWLNEQYQTIVGGKIVYDEVDCPHLVPGVVFVGWKPSRLIDMDPELLEAIPFKVLLEFFRIDAEICNKIGAIWSEDGFQVFRRCVELGFSR